MWLCTRNLPPLVKNLYYVNICISVHAITIIKVSITMFSWSEISVLVFKSLYLNYNMNGGRYESVDCSTGMEWWNGILE